VTKRIAITGIHTGIGKTIASAVLTEALRADYWKPVQAGDLENSDSIKVSSLITNGAERVHKEAIRLTEPMSPHQAAKIDGVAIDYKHFAFPETEKLLLIETAGGVLSPMTDDITMADFVQYYKLPAILVSQNYLGSINHTLLSVEALKSRNIDIVGIVMSGVENASSEAYIAHYSGVPVIARIPFLETISSKAVKSIADKIAASLQQYII